MNYENFKLKTDLNNLKAEIPNLIRDLFNKNQQEYETKYNTLKNGIDEKIINISNNKNLGRINKLNNKTKQLNKEKDSLLNQINQSNLIIHISKQIQSDNNRYIVRLCNQHKK